jgi:hypothetical protein
MKLPPSKQPPSKQPPLPMLPIRVHLLTVIQDKVSGDYISIILVTRGEGNVTFGTLVEKDRGI